MLVTEDINSMTMYTCRFQHLDEGEEFTEEHTFCYQISGGLEIYDGKKEQHFLPGDFRFCKKSGLTKFRKYEVDNAKFKSLSISLDQKTLKSFYEKYKGQKENKLTRSKAGNVIAIKPHKLYVSFVKSLMVYMSLSTEEQAQFVHLKVKELLLLVLKINPELEEVLFDFNDPEKIDLKAFMESNFRFNIPLERFAFLTGRSISTFKRDFEKQFNTSPGRWLIEKRLKEAKYLLKHKAQTPSRIYLDIGFENLSHFSYSYKQRFGINPSKEEVIKDN